MGKLYQYEDMAIMLEQEDDAPVLTTDELKELGKCVKILAEAIEIKNTIKAFEAWKNNLYDKNTTPPPQSIDLAIKALKQMQEKTQRKCSICQNAKKHKTIGNGINEPPYITKWECSVFGYNMLENDYCSYFENKETMR